MRFSYTHIAELLPEEKTEVIEELKRNYSNVARIGDGINDTLALAIVDIEIVMGSKGTNITIETADIALTSDNLNNIPT